MKSEKGGRLGDIWSSKWSTEAGRFQGLIASLTREGSSKRARLSLSAGRGGGPMGKRYGTGLGNKESPRLVLFEVGMLF